MAAMWTPDKCYQEMSCSSVPAVRRHSEVASRSWGQPRASRSLAADGLINLKAVDVSWPAEKEKWMGTLKEKMIDEDWARRFQEILQCDSGH